jgi:hypothetical protein
MYFLIANQAKVDYWVVTGIGGDQLGKNIFIKVFSFALLSIFSDTR